MFCSHVCLCTMCVPDAHEGQVRVLDNLEIKLWVTVSRHVGAGNQIRVVSKNNKHF